LGAASYGDPVPFPSPIRRVIDYLRARPILVLLLLSPGIPEYLSGSSPLNDVVLNPPWFLIQLGLNLGLYGPGVLLIREASVRWPKSGMIPVLILGAAYGILEEGIALSTLFNPDASVVHSLGSFGHFMGVNTVWLPGVLMVHMVFSIGLPIFLLGLALPETRGVRLLSDRGTRWAFAILGLDVALLLGIIVFGAYFWMGWPLFLGSFGAIALLILVAYWWPSSSSAAPAAPPKPEGFWVPWLAGALLFTGVVVGQGLGQTWGVPAAGVVAITVIVQLAIGVYAYRWVRGAGNEHRQLAFALGLLTPIMLFGFFGQFPLVLVLAADVALVVWFSRLLRAYPAPAAPIPAWTPPNPGAPRSAS